MPKKKIGLVLVIAAVVCGPLDCRSSRVLDHGEDKRRARHPPGLCAGKLFPVCNLFSPPHCFNRVSCARCDCADAGRGLFFGVVPGLIFAVTGLTLGAVIAFLVSRFVLGSWVQERYRTLLASFNEEIQRHGHFYLITLRVVPVLPFFLVNILAGLTEEFSLKRFAASTSIGLMPASFVYSFAGRRLAEINSPRDILSSRNDGCAYSSRSFYSSPGRSEDISEGEEEITPLGPP